jgi:hypothetical protein
MSAALASGTLKLGQKEGREFSLLTSIEGLADEIDDLTKKIHDLEKFIPEAQVRPSCLLPRPLTFCFVASEPQEEEELYVMALSEYNDLLNIRKPVAVKLLQLLLDHHEVTARVAVSTLLSGEAAVGEGGRQRRVRGGDRRGESRHGWPRGRAVRG